MIGTSWVNTVLVGDDLPELGTDLVTALAGLKVDNFSHVVLDLKNYHFSPKTQKYSKSLFRLTCFRSKSEMNNARQI